MLSWSARCAWNEPKSDRNHGFRRTSATDEAPVFFETGIGVKCEVSHPRIRGTGVPASVISPNQWKPRRRFREQSWDAVDAALGDRVEVDHTLSKRPKV